MTATMASPRLHGAAPKTGAAPGDSPSQRRARAIEQHWKALPPGVKEFVLGGGHLSKDGANAISIERLVAFWSSPDNVGATGRIDVCAAMWSLALIYLRVGSRSAFATARALTINGAFIHQCIVSSIGHIKKLCGSKAPRETIMAELSCCADGFYATESPAKMEHFIRRYFPRRTTTTNSAVADQSPIRMCPDERTSAEDIEKHIRSCRKVHIAFEDTDAAEEEHRSYGFEVLASTALKTLFVEYAAKRGVSLRLLRFSHAGRALFLSQVGKKTPEEMGLRDWDVIAVACQAPEDEETKGCVGRKNDKPVSNRVKPKRHRKSSKKKRARGPGKEKLTKREETLEELKILHSKALTRVHEELQPRLKQTRQRLNNLLLERTRPKDKSSTPRREPSGTTPPPSPAEIPCTNSLGKAGRSAFVVRAGAVENLYKTRKASPCGACDVPAHAPELDLHGCTREEALARLDESLEAWTDAAMRGSYPFVITARIVCGCGAQILSETVEEWIKSKRNVSNVPKKR